MGSNAQLKEEQESPPAEIENQPSKTIRDASLALYALGAIQIMLGYFIGDGAVVEGILFAFFGYLVTVLDPRKVGYLLLATACTAILVSSLRSVSVVGASVDHLALSMVGAWLGVRITQEARKKGEWKKQ